ncbi:MAG: hypothetical protein IKU65_02870 [Oscillospiraceae bacterium]|nr:hypothetical protein [Oscillospiraceae bacterium]
MIEINYDKNTVMRGNYPRIKKLGACSPYGEMTPFVWNGRLMRLELIDPSFATDSSIPRYAGIRDVETGEILSTFAEDSYFHSAYVEDGTVYVTGVDMKRRSTIRVYTSRDLKNWTNEVLFDNPGWRYYNNQITKGPDGYVIVLESDHPEYAGEPFTMFFAKSPDLKEWIHLDPTRFCNSPERYNGGPWIRYCDGWYYLITVTLLPCRRFTNYIFRSKDLETWYVGYYNPILMPDADDRKISPRAVDFTEERLEEVKHGGFNINNSDIDMCDWQGKVYINYLCSNQIGWYYMAEAEAEGTVADFLKSYFE